MLTLGRVLRKEGYRVVLYGYPSSRRGIVDHGAKFAEFLAAEVFPGAATGSVHLAGHSLGAIVIRQALGESPPPAVGRIVMFAPPNQGSRTAERLARWWGCRWLLRPLPELSAAPDALIHRVPVPKVEIGIIAGRDDGKVDTDLSHLPGNTEADHRVVPAYHSFLMNRADVQAATAAFLQTGRFP
jgi:pimeloyl-ACP methyl ester carboxylesterase